MMRSRSHRNHLWWTIIGVIFSLVALFAFRTVVFDGTISVGTSPVEISQP